MDNIIILIGSTLGILSCTIYVFINQRNLRRYRIFLLDSIQQAEKELIEDLNGLDMAKLPETPAGRELLLIIRDLSLRLPSKDTPQDILLEYPSSPNNPKTYALLVGVGDYFDPKIPDLPHASREVMMVRDALRNSVSSIHPENVRVLTDRNATRSHIIEGLWE